MDSVKYDRRLSCQVSPFRYLRINVYLPLPAAFRSLSRLSSALSAKASTLRSYCFYYYRKKGPIYGFLSLKLRSVSFTVLIDLLNLLVRYLSITSFSRMS